MARVAGQIWKEHRAPEFRECVGEDRDVKNIVPFPNKMELQPGETVVFSWIVFKSRAQRDRASKKVMDDPRRKGDMESTAMPFDMSRMLDGGFEVPVDL